MLETVEHQTGNNPSWTILWLHGLGADGNDFVPLIPELIRPGWPALRFVFPHAPVRKITINNGYAMRAWYDIISLDFSQKREDDAGVLQSIEQVNELIAREHQRGIAASNVLLAGFSQGGAIALAAGLRRTHAVAGIIALSTYLPMAESIAEQITPTGRRTPIFMAHGSQDNVVPIAAGKHSLARLQQLQVDVQWHDYPMPHSLCAEEVVDLANWLALRFGLSDSTTAD